MPRYTTKSFKEKVRKDSNGEIEFIDTYKGWDKKSKFKCKNGHIFEMQPYRFNCGDRCKYCSKNNKPTIEEIRQLIKEKYPEYELLSTEYKDRNTPLNLKHKKCGNEKVYINYTNLKFNNISEPCDLCKKKVSKYTNELYEARFNRLHKGNLTLLEKFEDTIGREDEHIKVKCNICGNVWYANKFWVCRYKNPTGCSKCKSSKGEIAIRNLLEDLGLYFEEQYSFNDLKLKRVFHFDFYVLVNNKPLLIEYDGRLHFEPYSSSEESKKKFEDTKLRDKMKNEYCEKNCIDLLRINYHEFDNIENIIKNKINKM